MGIMPSTTLCLENEFTSERDRQSRTIPVSRIMLQKRIDGMKFQASRRVIGSSPIETLEAVFKPRKREQPEHRRHCGFVETIAILSEKLWRFVCHCDRVTTH